MWGIGYKGKAEEEEEEKKKEEEEIGCADKLVFLLLPLFFPSSSFISLKVVVVPVLEMCDIYAKSAGAERVSSTRVTAAVEEGEMEEAANLLGRKYRVMATSRVDRRDEEIEEEEEEERKGRMFVEEGRLLNKLPGSGRYDVDIALVRTPMSLLDDDSMALGQCMPSLTSSSIDPNLKMCVIDPLPENGVGSESRCTAVVVHGKAGAGGIELQGMSPSFRDAIVAAMKKGSGNSEENVFLAIDFNNPIQE